MGNGRAKCSEGLLSPAWGGEFRDLGRCQFHRNVLSGISTLARSAVREDRAENGNSGAPSIPYPPLRSAKLQGCRGLMG